jgi:hypothetical protein
VGTNASELYIVGVIGLMPSKCTNVLTAHKQPNLAKGGTCWPDRSEQRIFPNAKNVGPKSVAPQLREAA